MFTHRALMLITTSSYEKVIQGLFIQFAFVVGSTEYGDASSLWIVLRPLVSLQV